jgi:hypothetical protein
MVKGGSAGPAEGIPTGGPPVPPARRNRLSISLEKEIGKGFISRRIA